MPPGHDGDRRTRRPPGHDGILFMPPVGPSAWLVAAPGGASNSIANSPLRRHENARADLDVERGQEE